MRTNLNEPWLSLRAKYGSLNEVARMIGITRRTFWNWTHGYRKPNGSGQRLMDLFLEAHGFPPFLYIPHPQEGKDAGPE